MQPKIQDIILRDDDFPESWQIFGLGLQ
jgi:hypothetical protein